MPGLSSSPTVLHTVQASRFGHAAAIPLPFKAQKEGLPKRLFSPFFRFINHAFSFNPKVLLSFIASPGGAFVTCGLREPRKKKRRGLLPYRLFFLLLCERYLGVGDRRAAFLPGMFFHPAFFDLPSSHRSAAV